MLLAQLLAILSLSLAAGQQPQRHPHAATLHKQAVTLLKDRLLDVYNPAMVKPLSDAIKEKLDQGRDFNLVIGPNLIKGRTGLYLAVWGDKVYTFNLTPKQIQMAEVPLNTSRLRDLAAEKDVGRTPDMVRLSKLSLEGGTRHKMNQELTGTIKFTVKKKFEGHAVLRVSCLSETNRATQYQHFPDGLPDNGEITLRLKPLKEINGRLLPSPAILFVDLCSPPDTDRTDELTVRSNAMAILIDLLDG
jgi:hypothetical protein